MDREWIPQATGDRASARPGGCPLTARMTSFLPARAASYVQHSLFRADEDTEGLGACATRGSGYAFRLPQMAPDRLTGGCGCGAVRFEVAAPLGPARYCH